MSHQQVRRPDGSHYLQFQRIGDGARHARSDGHADEVGVDGQAIGQTERDVGSAADAIAAQFLAHHAHNVEQLLASARHGAGGHGQGVDEHVGAGDAVGFGAFDDFLGDRNRSRGS